MDGGVTEGKLEILAYVRVETHDIHILGSLFFSHFIVETHGLCPTPYRASPVNSGLCLAIGCVTSSGFSSN